jgi:hypothetical protein
MGDPATIVSSRPTGLRVLPSLLGALACACFWLQQLVVPLHLALHCHTPPTGLAHADHAEHGHGHEDAHVHVEEHHGHDHERDTALVHALAGPWLNESPDAHDPHPADDHVVPFTEAVVLPTVLRPVLAPACSVAVVDLPEPVERELLDHDEAAPRPPPPGSTAKARAPTVAS